MPQVFVGTVREELPLSDKKSNQLDEKIDRFAERYKLWFVIPMVISGLMVFENTYYWVWVSFFVCVWSFVWAIGKILIAFSRLLPKITYSRPTQSHW